MSTINATVIKVSTFDWANTQLATVYSLANTANAGVNTHVTSINNIGKQQYSMFFPAISCIPGGVDNAEANTFNWGSGANNTIATMDFRDGVYDTIYTTIKMPKSWDGGSIFWRVAWMHKPTTVSFGVAWMIKMYLITDGTTINDISWGDNFGAGQAADTGGDSNVLYVSGLSSSVVESLNGNSWLPDRNALVALQVFRNALDGSDTLAVDAKMVGFWIYYTTDQQTDD